METILLLSLIVWGMTRYAGSELLATARGTEPPRLRDRRERAQRAHERRMARDQRRTGPSVGDALAARIADRISNPRGPRTPGPARQAMGEWWNDAWADATDRRHRHHQRRANGDLLRQRLARSFRERLGRGQRPQRQPWRPHRTDARPGGPRTPEEPPVVIDVVDEADPAPPQPTQTVDPDPGTSEDQEGPQQPTTEHDEPATQDPEPEPTPTPFQTDDSTATVHPIRKDTPMTGANPDLTSGETLDPTAAHAFCEQMKNIGARMHTELEQSVSSLRGRGVSGEPIDLLEQMQENAAIFQASAQTAMGHFDRHRNTQDQVLSDDTLAGTVNGTYIGTVS